MKKLEVLEALKNQMDSFYSLEQVIKIVESIKFEETTVDKVNIEDIEEAIENVMTGIECGRLDIIDRDSAEFGIGYENKVELENIDVNVNRLREELMGEILSLVKKEKQCY